MTQSLPAKFRRTALILFLLLINLFYLPAFAQYTWNGSATQVNCHCSILTQAIATQHGSVWNNNRIDLNQSFDFKFNVNLGCNDVNGADGIVFVLQNQNTSIGGSGQGMGYGGITPGVGVTLDTYQNGTPSGSGDCDPAYDHIAIQLNGNVNHCNPGTNVSGPVPISATSDNVEDCQWHVLRVTWDAISHNYSAYFDGVLRVTYTSDIINSVFSGNPLVFWGFTGATGGLTNLQQFCTSLSPSFHLLQNQSRCQGQIINFFDSSSSFGPIIKRYWDFGDGSPIDSVTVNPNHVYISGGDYTVSLTVVAIDGCSEVSTQSVHVGWIPVARFGGNNACQDSVVNFMDSSTAQSSSIISWYWQLGNGTTSTQSNPSVNYNSPGNKLVRLAVVSVEGCLSDTTANNIMIYPTALANFGFINTICSGGVLQFHDSSSVATGTIAGWNWNLDDGQLSTAQNPTGTYILPGIKQIILIAKSDHGCRSLPVNKTLTVIARPVASFFYTPICQSINITLHDSSYSSDGSTINQWWWDLGNGQISTSPNPSLTYNNTDSVHIQLVVHSVNGCISDTLKRAIFINAKPVADFRFVNACQDSTVNFTDSSHIANGSINIWYWLFGNGTSSTLSSPSTSYATPGTKIIKLVVTSAAGCLSDTATKQMQIYPRALANFGFVNNNICTGESVTFHDSSTAFPGSIVSLLWDLGDGQTSILPNPVGTYITSGIKNISLIATSDHGCKSTPFLKSLTVIPKPIAYFTSGPLCQASTATLIDSSYSSDGSSINSWWWNTGNGSATTAHNPQVVFNLPGLITIRHAVSSANGCLSDTIQTTLTINPKPTAYINVSSPLCESTPVQFSDSSATGITNYYWIFDNGITSNQQSPLQIFPAGNHTIKLLVSNTSGCISDTAFKTFIMNVKPGVGIDFLNSCKNTPVLFTSIDSTGNTVNQWQWTFGDGSTSSTSTPTHIFRAVGNYTIKLFGTSISGCVSNTVQKVINIFGTNASAGSDIIAAQFQPVQLHAVGGLSYQWSPPTDLSDPNIANPIAVLGADRTYYLKAFTPQGCESFDTINIKIYKGPEIYVPNAFSPNSDGHNDVFHAVPIGITLFNYLKIYNRWGQQIYNSSDYTKGWDGRFNGIDQPIGVYIWMASGVDFKGNLVLRKGTVLLVR